MIVSTCRHRVDLYINSRTNYCPDSPSIDPPYNKTVDMRPRALQSGSPLGILRDFTLMQFYSYTYTGKDTSTSGLGPIGSDVAVTSRWGEYIASVLIVQGKSASRRPRSNDCTSMKKIQNNLHSLRVALN